MNLEKYMYSSPYEFHTVKEFFDIASDKYARREAYRQIVDKNNEEAITFAEIHKKASFLGAQLIDMGLKGANIGIIGENSIEWMMSYFAITCGTGAAVPLDKELDVDTLSYQIDFSDAQAIFFSAKCFDKVIQAIPKCPQVKYWIVMRPQFLKTEKPEELLLQTDLVTKGSELSNEKINKFSNADVKPDDLCDLIYTSGTTGANKGVMLSQKNVAYCTYVSLLHIKHPKSSFACLPINHSYEKNANVLPIFAIGAKICINDDLMHIAQNIQRYSPALSVMVPMMLETFEHKIIAGIKKNGLLARTESGIKASNVLLKFGIDRREDFFQPILTNFGPNLREIVVGGAALKESTRKFFESIGISILNGYGITECAPLVSVNYSHYKRAGSVGHPMPGCKVKIADPDQNGDGNIWVKGDNVMLGYYKDEASNAVVFKEDGWFDTGDIGHLDKDGFIFITGRKKNLIILSNGKNVCPEEIEDMLTEKIPYIKDVIVYTDSDGLGIYMSVYLDPQFIEDNKIDDPYKYLMNDVKSFNKSIPSFKRIADVKIVDHEFEKTTTHKIKRFLVEKIEK